MSEVGAYEAKTHLPALLERVSKGESITITKHGVPIALLIPTGKSPTKPISEVIEKMRAFRRGKKLGKTSIKKLITEGRR